MGHRAGKIEDSDDDSQGKGRFRDSMGLIPVERAEFKINIPLLLSWALRRV